MTALFNPANQRGRAVKWGLVVQTAVMFMLATSFSALGINSQGIYYIDDREFPGVNGVLPPGPFGYFMFAYTDAVNVTPDILFLLSQWLADGFLVSALPRSAGQVFNPSSFSALPLLHYLLHEPLDHCLSMFDVPRLCL